jgi:lysozyme
MDLQKVTTMLVRDEGEVLHAYQDQLGYWTIGIGRLIDKRRGGGLTRDEARYLLANDIRKCDNHAKKYPWYMTLDDNRKAVIVGMIFQLGTAGFDAFKNTIAEIAAGRFDEAARRMLASKWAEQTPQRARRYAEIIRTGIWTY